MLDKPKNKLNLSLIARQKMFDENFIIYQAAEKIVEITASEQNHENDEIIDLRNLLWSSIDNEDSLDLDQVEVAEQLQDEKIRLKIGIADVDALVKQNSEIDLFAAKNTTSVYTGVETFPMLPKELSENKTSLLAGEERFAVVIEFTIDKNGVVKLDRIFRAIVINKIKLTYELIGEWLEGSLDSKRKSLFTKELKDQLNLQNEAARRLRKVRQEAGALEFGTVEATTIKRNSEIYDVIVKQKNEARYLIENLMITANVLIAEFLAAKRYPKLERIVRQPERWLRIVEVAATQGATLPLTPDSNALSDFLEFKQKSDPLHFPDLSLAIVKLIGAGDYTVIEPGASSSGHFGLAVNGYTHSTAPNRRYADLITQRLIKAAIKSEPSPYSIKELEQIAAHCNERQKAERKVTRFMRKIIAAEVLTDRIGETFEGIVTGVSRKGTFVRLITPPAEGRITSGEENLDVGDRVTVKLIKTIPEKGFVDFANLATING